MQSWDVGDKRCHKDTYVLDPIQNFIIPAIIVMSVGAMVYLGIKLFCNWYVNSIVARVSLGGRTEVTGQLAISLVSSDANKKHSLLMKYFSSGKVLRRQRSQLTRELEGMSSTPHQQTWVASYRVFSPLNNQSQPQLHSTPCMGKKKKLITSKEKKMTHTIFPGLFVPNIPSSPPPYEEALKHKVILSSYAGPQQPVYSYEPPPPLDETTTVTIQRGRNVATTERDHTRPLRYYPGEGNPQIPPVWNSIRMTELEEVHHQDRDHSRIQNVSVYRESRNARGSRSSRHYSPDQTRRTSVEGTWNMAPFRRVYLWLWPQCMKKETV